MRFVPAQLRDASQTPGSQGREVDGGSQRIQRLVGADVRGRLLPPDVLLPGAEGEHVSAGPGPVHGLTCDASAGPADMVPAEGKEPEPGTSEGHRISQGLALAHHHVGAHLSGGDQQPEGHGVGDDHEERAAGMHFVGKPLQQCRGRRCGRRNRGSAMTTHAVEPSHSPASFSTRHILFVARAPRGPCPGYTCARPRGTADAHPRKAARAFSDAGPR